MVCPKGYRKWLEPEKLSLDCISSLMYISFCGNKDKYLRFIEKNFDRILTYLKHQTQSHKLYVDKLSIRTKI